MDRSSPCDGAPSARHNLNQARLFSADSLRNTHRKWRLKTTGVLPLHPCRPVSCETVGWPFSNRLDGKAWPSCPNAGRLTKSCREKNPSSRRSSDIQTCKSRSICAGFGGWNFVPRNARGWAAVAIGFARGMTCCGIAAGADSWTSERVAQKTRQNAGHTGPISRALPSVRQSSSSRALPCSTALLTSSKR